MKKVILTLCFMTIISSLSVAQSWIKDLSIHGQLQPRYEYAIMENQENLSSFYLRRIRLDVRGSVYSEQLTYRIRPELSRSPGLEDAWINYSGGEQYEFRFGLLQIPFHWHRFISSSKHHFVERGVPSETFGFPSGRDFGLMFHGRNEKNTISYGAGIFDGAGPGMSISNSNGNMVSVRVSLAALGQIPDEEPDLEYSEQRGLSFGLGMQAANKNRVREWDLGRSADDNQRANWITGTADVSLRWRGFSLTADAYLRKVNPDAADVQDYKGWAYMAAGGYFVVPKRLEFVARYSNLRLDATDLNTDESEIGGGLNIYHREHGFKTRVQYVSRKEKNTGSFGFHGMLLVEIQVLF